MTESTPSTSWTRRKGVPERRRAAGCRRKAPDRAACLQPCGAADDRPAEQYVQLLRGVSFTPETDFAAFKNLSFANLLKDYEKEK